MIVTARNDVVHLSGALHRIQWLTIKAAAKLLLQQHPQGILIDCSELTDVAEDGTQTFLEAMRDIQGEGARIVHREPPRHRAPGSPQRPRRPLPASHRQVGGGGASVPPRRTDHREVAEKPMSENSILIPLLPGFDTEYAIAVAGRAARELRQPITLTALIVDLPATSR